MSLAGNSTGTGHIGKLLAEKWIEEVNDRIIAIKLVVVQSDKFSDELLDVVSKLGERGLATLAGDVNEHVSRSAKR